MTDTDYNVVNLDAMWVLASWVAAEGGVPGKWTRGVSCPVGFQHRIVVGGEAGGLEKVMTGLQGT